jgi:hypothetical protein
MVVHITYKKSGEVKYPSGHLVPQVGPLFVDMLTMTLEIPDHLQGATLSGFEKAELSGEWKSVNKTAYHYNLKPSDDKSILIQCGPVQPSHRFFRAEFNPSKCNLPNLKNSIDHIVPGGYAALIAEGVVTRIDLSVDAKYLDPTDIIATHGKVKVEKHFAQNGVIQSKYLGAASSSKQMVLYDKVAQLKHANAKKGVASAEPLPPYKAFRIETRFLKPNCTLQEVFNLPNPFSDLVLVAYPGSKSPKSYDPQWTLFLTACRFEGVKTALQHFNEGDRKAFMKRLHAEGQSKWWNPLVVWEGLPNALYFIVNPQ